MELDVTTPQLNSARNTFIALNCKLLFEGREDVLVFKKHEHVRHCRTFKSRAHSEHVLTTQSQVGYRNDSWRMQTRQSCTEAPDAGT